MKIYDIVSKLTKINECPIYYVDSFVFSAVTYLKPDSNKQRGLYLPKHDSLEVAEYYQSNMSDAFNRMKKMICEQCDFNDISFSVFCILHEIGHWIQYKNFIDEGNNDEQFIIYYDLQRDMLIRQRNSEAAYCKTAQDVKTLNKKYDSLYAELPTEKYANNFALEHLYEYVILIK